MSKKYPKSDYKLIDHALQMLEDYSNDFLTFKEKFNIKPYSEAYYNRNKDYFVHKDRMEICLFVAELTDMNYLEKIGDDKYIVRITEKGFSYLKSIRNYR